MGRPPYSTAVALTLAACVSDPGSLDGTSLPTDAGHQDGGTFVGIDGSVPDSGSTAEACTLVDVQLSRRVALGSSLGIAPHDLRVEDDLIHVTWSDGIGLRFVTLDETGAAVGPGFDIPDLRAETPRIFIRNDGTPAVIFETRDLSPQGRTDSSLRVADATGVTSLLTVEGDLEFGAYTVGRTASAHPPIAIAARLRSVGSYVELRASAEDPPHPLLPEYVDAQAFQLLPTEDGWFIGARLQDDIDLLKTTNGSPFIELIERVDRAELKLSSLSLVAGSDGAPILFYAINSSRLASLRSKRFDDTDPPPDVIQHHAGIFSGFSMSVTPRANGWAVVWPDFRDHFQGSDYYATRGLYFAELTAAGTPIRREADRRIVWSMDDDVAHPVVQRIAPGRYAAAYLSGSSAQLRVVIGAFTDCEQIDDHEFQTMR